MLKTPHRRWLLTTIDNPYNPFTQPDQWLIEDLRLGYGTPNYLARIASSSNIYNDDAELDAMRDVVRYNFSGVHIMVTPELFDELIKLPI